MVKKGATAKQVNDWRIANGYSLPFAADMLKLWPDELDAFERGNRRKLVIRLPE